MTFNLNSPYPAPKATRLTLLMGVFMGVFVGGFLLFFRPFGLAGGVYANAPEKVAFFGIITCLSFLFLEWLLPLAVPQWFPERLWRVWHRIAYYLLLFWLIATLNGLTINYFQDLTFSWWNYGLIIGRTLALGILPITMLVLYQYNRKLSANLKAAASIQPSANAATKPGEQLPSSSQYVAAEAFGNYVKVYQMSPQGLQQEVERITLSRFVEQEAAGALIRCHRSFAVNPAWVLEVSGNAQGLRLSLKDGVLEVPVSRTYIPRIKAALA